FFREIFVWQSLSHENVLPFLGVDRQLFPEELCTVSPWMSNGDLCEYIRNHALDPSVVNQLLFDCATGLQYLHSCDVIHGDLRASNVLIAPNGRALLTDFSLSHVVAEAGVVLTSESAYSFIRWNAPEYFREGVLVKTSMGDVYSFGCVCLEVSKLSLDFHQWKHDWTRRQAYTLNHPFPETRNKARVLWLVLQGVKPGSDVRDNPERFGISAQLWSLMEECWDADPSQRPTAEDLVESLRGVTRSPPKVGDVEESEGANQSLQDRTRT
ncbi:kinase-like protein, partial [Punctularia strigosozonata HHB-11173 SS5]|uniref:kinase-like protein n=1 Tax=Punctularia strigosozonata (strain HHB-11173) TaxID=741275 RepID=UPI0004416CB8